MPRTPSGSHWTQSKHHHNVFTFRDAPSLVVEKAFYVFVCLKKLNFNQSKFNLRNLVYEQNNARPLRNRRSFNLLETSISSPLAIHQARRCRRLKLVARDGTHVWRVSPIMASSVTDGQVYSRPTPLMAFKKAGRVRWLNLGFRAQSRISSSNLWPSLKAQPWIDATLDLFTAN